MEAFDLRTRADSEDLRRSATVLEDGCWGALGYLNYTAAHRKFYDGILDRFADLQLCLVDRETGRPVALANCVPTFWSGDPADLPAEGWDWLVEHGMTDRTQRANVLGALAISVPSVHRGKGYATRMIQELCGLSKRLGYNGVIAPVRPTSKSQHPYVPIGEYIGWRDERGRFFDPWLRAHLSQGGKLIGPCERSMVVEEHVGFWETWAGTRFERSGPHIVAGALVPIDIDLDREIGRYEEPNVWVAYATQ
jgi:hypothetical protein